MNTIYWAGDSTVQTNDITTFPQTGIGQVFYLYLKKNYTVSNYALNGRSTKSFMDEGWLTAIDEQISEGDFLFIQFGHNDEKSEDPTRYTVPGGTFNDNLRIYIHTARRHGAYPVLITPLERRCFGSEAKLGEGAHGPYVEAIRQVAKEENAALVDLNAKSRRLMNEAGAVVTLEWFMNLAPHVWKSCPEGQVDNTHLQYYGAVTFAGLIAEGLRECGGVYAEMLVESPENS